MDGTLGFRGTSQGNTACFTSVSGIDDRGRTALVCVSPFTIDETLGLQKTGVFQERRQFHESISTIGLTFA